MGTIEFKVALSTGGAFERDDSVRVEEDDNKEYISVKKPNGEYVRIFSVIDKEEKSTTDINSIFFSMNIYRIADIDAPEDEIGHITVGFFINYYIWFHIQINKEKFVNPRSGSGGGLQR